MLIFIILSLNRGAFYIYSNTSHVNLYPDALAQIWAAIEFKYISC